MSDICYFDSLIGNIFNIYYYVVNNLLEVMIVKRCSYVNIISYLIFFVENVGLYKGLKQLSELILFYQLLKDFGCGVQIVLSIISIVRQCNLDKDVELFGEEVELLVDERDIVVGRVYGKFMEIELRLLFCGLYVIGEFLSVEEVVVMFVNIVVIDRLEEDIVGLLGLLVQVVGCEIEDVYRSSDWGVFVDVILLNEIIQMSCEVVGVFVVKMMNKVGQVVNVQNGLVNFFGFVKKDLWMDVLQNMKFRNVDQVKMIILFEFLVFCLKQVVVDNELGGLKEVLEGRFVEFGLGGDLIRNLNVLLMGKNIYVLDFQVILMVVVLVSVKIVVDCLLECQKIENGGKYLEMIVLVLWGMDNIKMYGEFFVQVLWMVGVWLVFDLLGCVNKIELVFLEEFG